MAVAESYLLLLLLTMHYSWIINKIEKGGPRGHSYSPSHRAHRLPFRAFRFVHVISCARVNQVLVITRISRYTFNASKWKFHSQVFIIVTKQTMLHVKVTLSVICYTITGLCKNSRIWFACCMYFHMCVIHNLFLRMLMCK